jgi:hypothetical protein
VHCVGNGERVARFRARLGLHDQLTWDIRHLPQLFMVSPLVVARPSDYAPNILLSGFCTLPAPLYASYQPPADLAAFLAVPNDPVCISCLVARRARTLSLSLSLSPFFTLLL